MAKKAEVNKQGVFQGTMIEESGNVRIVGEDLTVGANLVKDSLKTNTGTGYAVITYNLSEALSTGTIYTVSIEAELSSDRQWIGVWSDSGETNFIPTLPRNNSNFYQYTITCPSNSNGKTSLTIFSSNNAIGQMQGSTPITGTCIMKSIKLEKGSIATPWVPNSADAAYSKLGFASANPNIHNPIKAEDFYEI